MAWVRIDDGFDEHPKIAGLDERAVAVFVFGLCYCNRNLTDGFIPKSYGRRVSARGVKVLESVGLWERVEGGWQVHDYQDYQPSKDSVLKERQRNAERQQRYRDNVSNAVISPGRNGVTPTVSNGGPVPNPVPVPKPSKETSTVSLRSTGSGKKPRAARGNSRVAAYIDAYRAFCGEHEPPMCPRDAAAIKRSTAPPELIAETYRVIKLGQWGTEFQRNNLCVHLVVGWVNAYALWREERGLEPFERRHDPGLVLVSA